MCSTTQGDDLGDLYDSPLSRFTTLSPVKSRFYNPSFFLSFLGLSSLSYPIVMKAMLQRCDAYIVHLKQHSI